MEVVKAFVALKPGFSPSQEIELSIMNFIRKKLSPLAMPQEIEFMDKLPKTRSGKIMRRLLKAQRAGRRARATPARSKTTDADEAVSRRQGSMKDAILDYVRNEYLDEDDEEDIELDENTPLISSGIVDSFSMVSLKTFLEKKFEIKIPTTRPRPRRSTR